VQFNTLLNLLLEANYNYKIPTDKEKLLFDFYTLEALDRYPQVDGGSWEFGGERYFQEREAIKDVKNTLLPFLKKELLDSAFFSIASELRHAMPYPETTQKGKHKHLKGRGLDHRSSHYPMKNRTKVEKLVRDFHDERLKLGGDRPMSSTNEREIAAEAARNLSFSEEEFIDLAEYIFNDFDWDPDYGGEAWGKIAAAWKKLHAAEGEDLYIWIDHMFSQQHNSGNVLDKLEAYRKGYNHEWITRALDLKFKIDNPWVLWRKASRDLQRLGSAVLMAKGYGSVEQFLKTAYNNPDKQDPGIKLSTTVLKVDEAIWEYMRKGKPDEALAMLFKNKQLPGVSPTTLFFLPDTVSSGKPLADISPHINAIVTVLNNKRFRELIKTRYPRPNMSNIGYSLNSLYKDATTWHIRNNDVTELLKSLEEFILDLGSDKLLKLVVTPRVARWINSASWVSGLVPERKDQVLANLISLIQRSSKHMTNRAGMLPNELSWALAELGENFNDEEIQTVKDALNKVGVNTK
jgi:hypothetical protein